MVVPPYTPSEGRYETGLPIRRAGRSGIRLPEVVLGLWHNFDDNLKATRNTAFSEEELSQIDGILSQL